MNTALLVGFVIVMVVTQVAVFTLWRRGSLSHRRAAALRALPVGAFLVGVGVLSGDWVYTVPVAAFVGLITFGFGEFFFKYIGGEFDPPSSKSYRRRDL